MNTFKTETDEQYVHKATIKPAIITWLVMSGLCCFGFLISWITVMYLEIIVIAVMIISYKSVTNNPHDYELYFEDATLFITDRARKSEYVVYDVPASDFVITQTKAETALDYCSFTVKHTVFAFGGVKNCTQLRQYIADNFPRH